MIRHYAPLTSELFDDHFLNRKEVLRVTDLGAQLGFAVSVLDERKFFETPGPPKDGAKSAAPLLTWPFLDFVESLDLYDKTLLELGAGNSTTWFSERFAKVRSFEMDAEWHRAVSGVVGKNVDLSLVELDVLENAEIEYRDEDWILVDFAGKRTKFIAKLLSKLAGAKKPAAIVLDNSDWFRRGAELLRSNGYLEIPFYGFKSTQAWISCTSVFIEPGRFRAPLKNPFYQPPFAWRSANKWDSVE